MLIGQSILLGLLVDYFTDVNRNQVVNDCIANVTMSVPSSSTRDAYLAAMGECAVCVCV